MGNEERFTKADLIDYIDTELAEKEESTGFPDRDAEYFHQTEIMTFARNAIYNMPISDYQAGLMERQGGCSILYDIYCHWRAHMLEWGEWQTEKLSMSFDLVQQYIDSIEHKELNRALYDRALADITRHTASQRETPIDDFIMQSRYFTAYNAALSLMEPDKKRDNQLMLTLLTYDRPVKAICDRWQNQKNEDVISIKDLHCAMLGAVCARQKELEAGMEGIETAAPETQGYIDLYLSRYVDGQAAEPSDQEQDMEQEV